ncbi:thiazole biosynthesis family protein [Actinosynnema pretiosum subsp. pretiosum]|uniref:thiazole synthase n=1 Tax=Actinosynnema pretiosum subsp. pretiosum TaxID=103721 RepID=A0AA45L5K7_9PSEU|nr:Thiazole biosynthesis protein ThiG [Actinosynnema pretiosum subsp. pretiosum]QUF03716.1 thiazole biosynthesis family protein [Actinosynnema pretiosum subsp. pretiosum]
MTERITASGVRMTSFWHCFGTERHRAGLDTVIGLLRASGTDVLPINTHRLDDDRRRDALEHGFAGVTYDRLAEHVDVSGYVKMVNVNLRTTADEAAHVAKLAVELTGERVIKLEVLTPDLRSSRDAAVVEVARRLLRWEPSLVVLPLLSNDHEAARAAVDAGCPLLRVMGSPIGARAGITDPAAFARTCALPVPVVLDGGIGSTDHVRDAAAAGASGLLVNSVLFDDGRPPVEVMADFRASAEEHFGAGALSELTRG